ncbi:hypothetical protein [Parabacteroides sp. FAFU027]|uniref:hypothetical protein n=1 Tax=Parabacteroides sp. FAFU027 TaxID=2922715 RepID=UPI001FAECB7E|nr:hypothetical protein [Parabacteroides sp. FAFU027]
MKLKFGRAYGVVLLNLILFLVSMHTAYAKVPVRNYNYYTYIDRFRVNLSVGPQVYLGGKADIHYGIFNRITPAFSLSAYQQFCPYWAYRLRLSGGQFFATQTRREYGSEVNILMKSRFSTLGAGADMMLSLNRVFSTRSMEQVPNVWLFAGISADAVKSPRDANDESVFPVFNSGLYIQIPYSAKFDFSVELKGGIVQDRYNGFYKNDLTVVGGPKLSPEGYGSLLLGATYKF